MLQSTQNQIKKKKKVLYEVALEMFWENLKKCTAVNKANK